MNELSNILLFFVHLRGKLYMDHTSIDSGPISEAEEICIFPPIFSSLFFLKIYLDVRFFFVVIYLDVRLYLDI
jgi:hypothetical protein